MYRRFLASNAYEIHVNASITVKLLGGIASYNGKLKMRSKGNTCIFVVFCLAQYNTPSVNISLAASRSVVSEYIVVRARDISTLQLTSNQ